MTIEPRAIAAPPFVAWPGVVEPLATTRCASILAAGAGRWAREWARLTEQRRHNGLRSFAAAMACRSPADLIAAQADMVSEHLDLIGRGSGALAKIVDATAGEAVRALSAEGGA
jgi:hypothetical protein